MKKKLDLKTKTKLIYSGELLLIALVFIVIAILELTWVIKISNRHHTIFNFVTLGGAALIIGDFLWALLSKKRRKRVCLLDKFLVLPIPLYVIPFDIISLTTKQPQSYYQIGMPLLFIYVAIIYTFESFYHYKYPIPGLLDDLDEQKVVEENSEEK